MTENIHTAWWSDLENAKSVFDDMSLVLMIKLKTPPLVDKTKTELIDIQEFLDTLLSITEFYPDEKQFQELKNKFLKIRMMVKIRLRKYSEAEVDCLTLLRLLEDEKESIISDNMGIRKMLGVDRKIGQEIGALKSTLAEILKRK